MVRKEKIMAWEFENDRPIYTQILEHIELSIISGNYKPGDKLPSVRELAGDAAVNPNTMQRALAELERRMLVHSERTTGRFITEDMELISQVKERTADNYIDEFVVKMKKIGFSEDEILEMMRSHMGYERMEE